MGQDPPVQLIDNLSKHSRLSCKYNDWNEYKNKTKHWKHDCCFCCECDTCDTMGSVSLAVLKRRRLFSVSEHGALQVRLEVDGRRRPMVTSGFGLMQLLSELSLVKGVSNQICWSCSGGWADRIKIWFLLNIRNKSDGRLMAQEWVLTMNSCSQSFPEFWTKI